MRLVSLSVLIFDVMLPSFCFLWRLLYFFASLPRFCPCLYLRLLMIFQSLMHLARHLKQKRLDAGALELASSEVLRQST